MRQIDFSDGFTSSSEPTSVGFPASSISVTPSGNLAADDVQEALVEHQGDINTINNKIGAINGIATLDSGGKVPASQIPLVGLVDVNVVADIAARDALTVQEGDVAVVTDAGSGVSKTYIYNGSTWTELISDGSLYSHLTDSADAHSASAITNSPSGNLAATTVQSALNELQADVDTRATSTDLTNHLNDTTDAHDASAISNVASGNLAATDVQAALNELQTDVDTRATSSALSAHISDTTDAHAASAIGNTPSGNLSATDVQAALNELQTAIDALSAGAAPTGAVLAYAGSSAPTGYLLCDGSAVSRSTYSDLFSVIGITHGQGNGTTTFHVPDYRGRFLRGVDASQGRDPNAGARTAMNTGGNTGDDVGSIQGHAMQTHTHVQDAHSHGWFWGNGGGAANYLNSSSCFNGSTSNINGSNSLQSNTATNQNAGATGTHAQASADETRPVNAAVKYIIKI